MARKESVTRKILSEGAFELLKEQGMEMLTARKLAGYIGCSTQPIFRIYSSMDDLADEMFIKASEYYENYCINYIQQRQKR